MTVDFHKRILVVGHCRGNARLLGKAVNEIGATPVHADSEEAVNSRLADGEAVVHLAVVDITGCSKAVWYWVRVVQQRSVPFIVIAPQLDQWANTRLLEYGACCVLQKPAAKPAVLSALGNLSDRCA